MTSQWNDVIGAAGCGRRATPRTTRQADAGRACLAPPADPAGSLRVVFARARTPDRRAVGHGGQAARNAHRRDGAAAVAGQDGPRPDRRGAAAHARNAGGAVTGVVHSIVRRRPGRPVRRAPAAPPQPHVVLRHQGAGARRGRWRGAGHGQARADPVQPARHWCVPFCARRSRHGMRAIVDWGGRRRLPAPVADGNNFDPDQYLNKLMGEDSLRDLMRKTEAMDSGTLPAPPRAGGRGQYTLTLPARRTGRCASASQRCASWTAT